MSARCNSRENLEVHHKRVDGGIDLKNAEVLCRSCHAHTSSYGDASHTPPPPFSETTKKKLWRMRDTDASANGKTATTEVLRQHRDLRNMQVTRSTGLRKKCRMAQTLVFCTSI